jgi:conjugal transfer pilus assembly protein TraE
LNLIKFGRTWDFALKNNAVLLASNAVLVLAVLLLSVKAIFTHDRVVLTPPHMEEKMEVAWNEANAEYYKGFGLYAVTLIGNVTPKNAMFVAESLSMITAPKVYAPIRNRILALAKDPNFLKANTFNFFSPDQVIWEAGSSKVFVIGKITSSAYNAVLTNSIQFQNVVYEMKFEMRNGRPVIVGFNSYPGQQARTLKWLDNNKPPEAKESDLALTAEQPAEEVALPSDKPVSPDAALIPPNKAADTPVLTAPQTAAIQQPNPEAPKP